LVAWCAEQRERALPVEPITVCRFLIESAPARRPYRRPSVNGAGPKVARGWASSPTRAANTIRSKFSDPDELAELVRLLNEHLAEMRADSA
jgi:hypothetical protein